jgi:hypothetical protein
MLGGTDLEMFVAEFKPKSSTDPLVFFRFVPDFLLILFD